jgi:malate dehydrogenase
MASFAMRIPRVVAPRSTFSRRALGTTTTGPAVGDWKANLCIAKKFVTEGGSRSYDQFKQQCLALRVFAFAGVTSGCVLALIVNPPKSSYWQRWSPTFWWSHIKSCFSGGAQPLFLTEAPAHEFDVPAFVHSLSSPAPAKKKKEEPPAPVATPEPAASAEPAAKQPVEAKYKVCVCGGAGGIGQPLSLLMALDDRVKELCVFDLNIAMVPAEGVAADLSHIETPANVKAFALDKEDKPIDKLEECLTGCDLVLVPAGLPRRPGMTRSDLLGVNAGIAKNIVEACAKYCPNAVVALIVNPVNSVVPAMAELYRKAGKDPSKIVGVTTLDGVRANKFVAEITGAHLSEINIPVIGGHAGETILPLFSQDAAGATIAADVVPSLDKRVQDAGTEVVNAKKGKGSATLSMAYAGARLGKAVLSGLDGDEGASEYAYVASSVTELPYFTSKVTFGKTGVEKVHPLDGPLSDHEKQRLEALTPILKGEIEAGLTYAGGQALAE